MSAQELKHIVRIGNVDLPGNKPIRFALTKIKGMGVTMADAACSVAGVPRTTKAGALSDTEIQQLDAVVKDLSATAIPRWMLNRRKDYESGEDTHLLTGGLNFSLDNDKKRLGKIKSWRGLRLQKRLPVRGQRTKSNFRRSKGKVVGVKKKK